MTEITCRKKTVEHAIISSIYMPYGVQVRAFSRKLANQAVFSSQGPWSRSNKTVAPHGLVNFLLGSSVWGMLPCLLVVPHKTRSWSSWQQLITMGMTFAVVQSIPIMREPGARAAKTPPFYLESWTYPNAVLIRAVACLSKVQRRALCAL